jgi:hypothetical protein
MTSIRIRRSATFIVSTLVCALMSSDRLHADDVHPHLPNAGFEQWQDGQPVGWTLKRGSVFVEDRHRIEGSRSLDLQVDRRDQNPEKLPMRVWPYSEMVSDRFHLEPHSQYRLSAWLNLQRGSVGDWQFTIKDSDGVVVGEYHSGWATGHVWLQITTSVRTRAATEFRMIIGGRSGFGRQVLVDDIKVEKVGGSSAIAGQADQERGFSLFTRSVMESLDIQTRLPSPAEMIETLRIRLTRGEYEPALLGLYALQDMQGVDVVAAGDLAGPDGARIPQKDIVIRRLDAELLPLSRPRNVKANEMLAWWSTVKSEQTTPAGLYRGELQLTAAGEEIGRLPLEVEVLDVTLPAPDIAFWAYHHETYFDEHFLTPELQKAYYRDMVEHGMNTVSVYNNADVDGSADVDFAHNSSQKGNAQYKYGLDTIVPWILESGLCAAGQPLFYVPSRGDEKGSKGYGWGGVPRDALQATLEGWQDRNWPELVLYCGDEPYSDTGLVPRLKMVKSWFPSVRLTTAGIEPDVLGEHYDVWIQGEASIDRDVARQARDLNAELWAYNCTAPNTNMPFARAFYGFWAYRTGVKGVTEWAYYDLPGWTADAEGNSHGDPGSRHSRICVSPAGPIPTISWEAAREGIDDFRHAQLLRDMFPEADGLHEQLAEEAEQLLSEADRETIDERQGQQFYQIKPDAAVITWEPSSADEARGEQLYLLSRENGLLTSEIEYARRALDVVMESIPFDAMVTRTGLNYHMPKWSRWAPPMGPQGTGENPVTITEDKRRVLVSYIISLQDTMQQAEDVLQGVN